MTVMNQRMAVIDFETTGMNPHQGARAAEVGIVMVERGRIVDRFDSLMNAGQLMPPFVAQLTGITNAMLADAPDAAGVMREAQRFVGDAPMIAHNASFDSKFWRDELQRAEIDRMPPFACTVLLSRRLYPEAPSHSLSRIVRHLHLPAAERAHRALADAEMTAHLLLRMLADLETRWGIAQADHALLRQLQICPPKKTPALLERLGRQSKQLILAETTTG